MQASSNKRRRQLFHVTVHVTVVDDPREPIAGSGFRNCLTDRVMHLDEFAASGAASSLNQ